MDGLFVFLVREKDFSLTRSTLMNIALHFQMYAGWDGFANAFKLYAPWRILCWFYLIRLFPAGAVSSSGNK